MEQAIRNEAFAAKLALTYGEMFDGISPVKQRVSLRIRDRMLEIKNVQTQFETRWNIDEMRELADQAEREAMTFAADGRNPARLVVREVDALRALAETGAQFPPLRGRGGDLRKLLLALIFAGATGFGIVFLTNIWATQYPELFGAVLEEFRGPALPISGPALTEPAGK